MPLSDSNNTDEFDNTIVVLNGQTDNTGIGNVGDRLKVTANLTSSTPPVYDPQFMGFHDMNVANGGIAREAIVPATWTDLYSYTGDGVFFCFMVNYENDSKFWTRVLIDGLYYPLFGTTGVGSKELKDNNIYDIKDLSPMSVCGLALHDHAVRWEPKYGISFNTSFKVQARYEDGNKKFRAGFVGMYLL